MATKKDLVEAYSFSRRRLVTAFVSGAPGGREVEPSRPGRTIVGGVALAVLMIAGAAVLGILTNRDPGDWEKVGLVSEKETGANYVILTEDGPLRPVVNITSAMLLLGPDLEKTDVGRDAIADKARGEPIGILQAPGTPPAAGQLRPAGWTACTGSATGQPSGVQVTLTAERVVEGTSGVGYVVRSQGRLYLVAESLAGTTRGEPRAYSYEITQRNADPILTRVVETNTRAAVDVPRQWLDLFTPGAPLTLASLGLEAGRLGKPPADPAQDLPDGSMVGDLVAVSGTTYLVTDTDTATELDPFALEVYTNLTKPGGFEPRTREASGRPGTIQDTADLGSRWPTRTLEPKESGEFCAQLDAVEEGAPGARLVDVSDLDSVASAAEVPAGSVERFVEPGRGAVVRVGDWDVVGEAPTSLIDDRGFVYPLIGEAKSQLGYADVPDVVVPDTWVGLFPDGVELSVDAARCPPTTEPEGGPCAS